MRTEGSRPRPRTQKKIRGQVQLFREQTLSKPRTGMLEAKVKDQGHRRRCSQKKGLQKFFSGDFQKRKTKKNKKGLCKFSARFLAFFNKVLTFQKTVRAEDRAIFKDLRLRDQGLDLRGQGLQNVFSRTPPLNQNPQETKARILREDLSSRYSSSSAWAQNRCGKKISSSTFELSLGPTREL